MALMQEGLGTEQRPCPESYQKTMNHSQISGEQCKTRESSGVAVSQESSWGHERRCVSLSRESQQPQVSLVTHHRSCRGEARRRLSTADQDSKYHRCSGAGLRLGCCALLWSSPHFLAVVCSEQTPTLQALSSRAKLHETEQS